MEKCLYQSCLSFSFQFSPIFRIRNSNTICSKHNTKVFHGPARKVYRVLVYRYWHFLIFWEKSHNLIGKKSAKKTKFQAEPGLHGLSFRQKWREYAQNMLLLIAERLLPATDAKFTEKSTCMSFFGENAEGRKFLLIFQIKILMNISKLCNG